MRRTKSKIGNLLLLVSVAASFFLVAAGSASADDLAATADMVDCGGRSDFLHVYGRNGYGPQERCYANAGKAAQALWVDRISTGNNDIVYRDYNGEIVRIDRWTDISFPNRPPYVDYIIIL
ncbi:beta/gamma crystallin domain-containing protein [Lentzea sp. NPDC004782]|uniref:beta/gamma crystallin domain-containing protein n=1 Tax=Lentzea sp. NPDC004782 TaxID=3154458 RepID=UPI0033A7E6CB